jgi:hypothetical protein
VQFWSGEDGIADSLVPCFMAEVGGRHSDQGGRFLS